MTQQGNITYKLVKFNEISFDEELNKYLQDGWNIQSYFSAYQPPDQPIIPCINVLLKRFNNLKSDLHQISFDEKSDCPNCKGTGRVFSGPIEGRAQGHLESLCPFCYHEPQIFDAVIGSDCLLPADQSLPPQEFHRCNHYYSEKNWDHDNVEESVNDNLPAGKSLMSDEAKIWAHQATKNENARWELEQKLKAIRECIAPIKVKVSTLPLVDELERYIFTDSLKVNLSRPLAEAIFHVLRGAEAAQALLGDENEINK